MIDQNEEIHHGAAKPDIDVSTQAAFDAVDLSAVDLEEAVVLRTFSNRQEADLAVGFLHSCGIPVIVMGDDCGGLRPELSRTRGVQILVSPDYEKEAGRLLEEIPEKSPTDS